MLDELNGEWVSFQQCLIDSDVMLKKSKDKFKTGLINSSEEFKKTVGNLFEEFQSKGPFSSSIAVKEVRPRSLHFNFNLFQYNRAQLDESRGKAWGLNHLGSAVENACYSNQMGIQTNGNILHQ